MAELRWALLALGVLFVAALAWWEYRRPRHAATDQDAPRRHEPTLDMGTDGGGRGTGDRDLVIPDMRTSEVSRDPPLQVVDESALANSAMQLHVADEVAVDAPGARSTSPPIEPVPAEQTAAGDRRLSLQWPPAEQQRIVWLRVVPQPPARFSGRALRQALLACDMEYGPQQIFHRADVEGRVIVSAANLTRPGSFDPQTMDALHFHGLNVFAVLPGPLPADQTVDELMAVARDLAQRLAGLVQDELGRPLDAARMLALRNSVVAESAAGGADA